MGIRTLRPRRLAPRQGLGGPRGCEQEPRLHSEQPFSRWMPHVGFGALGSGGGGHRNGTRSGRTPVGMRAAPVLPVAWYGVSVSAIDWPRGAKSPPRPTRLPLAGFVLALCALVAGCGSGGSRRGSSLQYSVQVAHPSGSTSTTVEHAKETPEQAVKRQVREALAGDWGSEWNELHPGQQAIVRRAKYLACHKARPGDVQVRYQGILGTTIDVEGVPERSAEVVYVNFTTASDSFPMTPFGVVLHYGHWRWYLENKDIAAYRSGECPGSSG
jgi:hypothetical protein